MSNIVTDIIINFQNLVAQVPDVVQPLIVAAAGAIPFIDGEGAAAIGIIGGIHPIVAAVAGAAGNFIAVALLVLLGARVRTAVTAKRAGADGSVALKERSPRGEKFQNAFARYGVPGVSLLGPLLLPGHFTAVALVSAGVSKGRVLFWQAVSIALWTTAITLLMTGVIRLAAG